VSVRGYRRSDVAARAIRTLRILAARRCTVEYLSGMLGCSARQVYRIIHAIQAAGVRVSNDRATPGEGWWIRRADMRRWLDEAIS
jgi:predicted DNA-binding transcriptional regulator YafY